MFTGTCGCGCILTGLGSYSHSKVAYGFMCTGVYIYTYVCIYLMP